MIEPFEKVSNCCSLFAYYSLLNLFRVQLKPTESFKVHVTESIDDLEVGRNEMQEALDLVFEDNGGRKGSLRDFQTLGTPLYRYFQRLTETLNLNSSSKRDWWELCKSVSSWSGKVSLVAKFKAKMVILAKMVKIIKFLFLAQKVSSGMGA